MSAPTIELIPASCATALASLFRNHVRSLHTAAESASGFLPGAAESLRQILEGSQVAIFENPVAGAEPRLTALSAGRFQPGELSPELDIASGAIAEALRTGTMRIAQRISASGEYCAVFPDAESEVIFPILHQRKVLGVAVIGSPTVEAFSRERLDFAGLFADQIGVAWHQRDTRIRATFPEADWSALSESSRDGLILCDDQLRVRRVNRAFLRFAKRPVAELTRFAVSEVFQRLSLFGSREDFWQRLESSGREVKNFRSISGRRQFRIEAWRMNRGEASGYSIQLRETTADENFSRRLRQSECVRFGGEMLRRHTTGLDQALAPLLTFVRSSASRVDGVHSSEEAEILGQSCADVEATLEVMRAEVGVSAGGAACATDLGQVINGAFAAWQLDHQNSAVRSRFSGSIGSFAIDLPAGAVRELIVLLLNRAQRGVLAEPGANCPEVSLAIDFRDETPILSVSHNGFARSSGALFAREVMDPATLEWAMARQIARTQGIELREMFPEPGGLTIEARFLPAPENASSATGLAGGEFTGLRVLLVEEDAMARDLMEAVLTEKSALVTAVETIDDALAAMGRLSFDVVLSEAGAPLPSGDGLDLESEIRQREPALAKNVRFVAGWEWVAGPLPAIDRPGTLGGSGTLFAGSESSLKPAA